MNRKHEQSIYHANVNINLMVENLIQIKTVIAINADVSAKKHNIWNPAKCSCKNVKYLANIMFDSVITCDEITDTGAKS